MQKIIIYISAAETVGIVRDAANAKNIAPPVLIRGVATCLKLRLFANKNSLTPYDIADLTDIATWDFVFDHDFVETTTCVLKAEAEHIAVATITENDEDGTERNFTEITIPIPVMNTVELANWLGTQKSKTGLIGELVGYSADGVATFILQIENFTIRNRLTHAGDPTEIPDVGLAQINTMIDQRLDERIGDVEDVLAGI
ncbi:MAG: hypothetical protein E7047_03820 [Lentisphaerae bacterium]|nr:hypothetical protein [Lentisphaerota bacterium]